MWVKQLSIVKIEVHSLFFQDVNQNSFQDGDVFKCSEDLILEHKFRSNIKFFLFDFYVTVGNS